MHSKAKPPTKAERRRMERIVELGCVACRKDGIGPLKLPPCEVHHLLDGGVRRGHGFTIGLCAWHHRGKPLDIPGLASRVAYFLGKAGSKHPAVTTILEHGHTQMFGPSLANGSRPFHERYGSDDELLEYQNTILAAEVLCQIAERRGEPVPLPEDGKGVA